MQTIEILDIKPFMQLIFQTDQFDGYDFVSADIRTDISCTLDGHLNTDFFSNEELEHPFLFGHSYLPWNMAKEKVFSLIKGKRTPSLLKIVLKSSDANTQALLASTASSLHPKDIDGMFVNILFQNQQLHVICGVAYHIYTLEKELEEELRTSVVNLLKQQQITCSP